MMTPLLYTVDRVSKFVDGGSHSCGSIQLMEVKFHPLTQGVCRGDRCDPTCNMGVREKLNKTQNPELRSKGLMF